MCTKQKLFFYTVHYISTVDLPSTEKANTKSFIQTERSELVRIEQKWYWNNADKLGFVHEIADKKVYDSC
ncbi:hypothetical protein ABWW58_09920 [Sporolactobacillus sp. STCC-11]|uniref:hypothetical protein n=1 Tax=Sporolactobacillus caesalpiniae TaxID=3230362 RepID=UPI00339AE54A